MHGSTISDARTPPAGRLTVARRPGRIWADPLVETPLLVVDTAVVAQRYEALARALPDVHLHFAVKANPAQPVLETLATLGCRWDVASLGEVQAALAVDPDPAHLSYGNRVKKAADVAAAYALGVRRFTVDCAPELAKVSRHAPGSTVLVRIVDVVLAGPTCDSIDVLFGSYRYRLPLDLRPGDRIRFGAAGAYLATYSTVGFNGFAPLRVVHR